MLLYLINIQFIIYFTLKAFRIIDGIDKYFSGQLQIDKTIAFLRLLF